MAQYCIEELNKEQMQVEFDVLLAAFAVYFRTSRDFLKNKGDQESIKAKQYVEFNATSAEELEDELNTLHWQILHLSGKRTSVDERKLGLAGCNKLNEWLRENMSLFVKALPDHFHKEWMSDFGYVRPHDELAKRFTGPSQSSSATSHVTMVQTRVTHSTQLATPFVVEVSKATKE